MASRVDNENSTRQRRIRGLVMFSGAQGDDSVAAQLRALGMEVDEIDNLIGGASHNMLKMRRRMEIINAVRAGEYDVIWMAPPCGTWSVVREPPLRSGKMINGLDGLSDEDKLKVKHANELAQLVAVVAHTAEAAGVPWFIEQPADRGDEASDAHWEGLMDPPHMFKMPFFKVLQDVVQPTVVTFPQCALGAAVQKYTSIMGSKSTHDLLQVFNELRCTHQHHEERIKGVDERGQLRSA